jgi:hypothetical protein
MKKLLVFALAIGLICLACAKKEEDPIAKLMQICLEHANEACPVGTYNAGTLLAADYSNSEETQNEIQSDESSDSSSYHETEDKSLIVVESGDCAYKCAVMQPCGDGSVPIITKDKFECKPVEGQDVTYDDDDASAGDDDDAAAASFCESENFFYCEDFTEYQEGDPLNGWCAGCSLVLDTAMNQPLLGSFISGSKEASLKINLPASFEIKLYYPHYYYSALPIKLADQNGDVLHTGIVSCNKGDGICSSSIENASGNFGIPDEITARLRYQNSDHTYRLYMNDQFTVSYYSAAFTDFTEINFPIEKDILLLSHITIKALE